MYECENFNNSPSEDELMHYGVIGMKWGVRRARKTLSSSDSTKEAKAKAKASLDKHYVKASKKLDKFAARADKNMNNARMYALRSETSWNSNRAAKSQQRATKYRRKAMISMRNGERWIKSMDKTFKDTPINLSQEQRDTARRFVETMNTRVMSRY